MKPLFALGAQRHALAAGSGRVSKRSQRGQQAGRETESLFSGCVTTASSLATFWSLQSVVHGWDSHSRMCGGLISFSRRRLCHLPPMTAMQKNRSPGSQMLQMSVGCCMKPLIVSGSAAACTGRRIWASLQKKPARSASKSQGTYLVQPGRVSGHTLSAICRSRR